MRRTHFSFSSLQESVDVETVPLANAAEAYGRMMRNEARSESCWLPGSNHAPIQNGLLTTFFVGPATQSEAADAMNRSLRAL